MDKKLYYIDLYDYYGELLTDKQRHYFEDYYFKDLSLAEIAENDKVSRNAVHHQIKIVLERLDEFEKILQLQEKRIKIRKIVEDFGDLELAKKLENLL